MLRWGEGQPCQDWEHEVRHTCVPEHEECIHEDVKSRVTSGWQEERLEQRRGSLLVPSHCVHHGGAEFPDMFITESNIRGSMEASRPGNSADGSQFLCKWGGTSIEEPPKNLGLCNPTTDGVVGEASGVVEVSSKVSTVVADTVAAAHKGLTVIGRDRPEMGFLMVKSDVDHGGKTLHGGVCTACGVHISGFTLPIVYKTDDGGGHCLLGNYVVHGHVE